MNRKWKVMPVCSYQKLDVRKSDLLAGGDFRKCETYRGGGGYDQFPSICERRIGRRAHMQFVVQLYGCSLDCPYCYVTRAGVWGAWKPYTTDQLVDAFKESGQEVFHLMGGAPALYLDKWPELIHRLPDEAVFHSDFLLVEGRYSRSVLTELAVQSNRCLFAVDVKGVTPDDWQRNTRRWFDSALFSNNLDALVECGVPFYLTFTNPDKQHLDRFTARLKDRYGPGVLEDSFVIDLIDYNALPFVDEVR